MKAPQGKRRQRTIKMIAATNETENKGKIENCFKISNKIDKYQIKQKQRCHNQRERA